MTTVYMRGLVFEDLTMAEFRSVMNSFGTHVAGIGYTKPAEGQTRGRYTINMGNTPLSVVRQIIDAVEGTTEETTPST